MPEDQVVNGDGMDSSEWQVRHRQELSVDRIWRGTGSPRARQAAADLQVVLDLLDEERNSIREVASLAEQASQLVLSYRGQIIALQAQLHVLMPPPAS
jgi:hypothetical protein